MFLKLEKKKLDHFAVYIIGSADINCSVNTHNKNIKFGIILSKKNVKLSVDRNLIRRWVKELLKSYQLEASIIIKTISPVQVKSRYEKNLLFNELKKLVSLAFSDLK